MSDKKNVTMQHIADKLGVTKVTVSKALNEKDGVSPEMREKIKQTAAELGYKFNFFGKALKLSQFFNIGIIIAERFFGKSASFYAYMYKVICQELEEYRFTSTLHVLPAEKEKEVVLPRMIIDNKIDGLIVIGQIEHDYIAKLCDQEFEILFLDYYTNDFNIDSVITDNFFGSYELTTYLINNGFKDITFVGNINATSSIQDRYLGYCKALIEHGLFDPQSKIINDRDNTGKPITLEIPHNLPEVFVCNCDRVAYALIRDLQKIGFNIPEDVSIVGFDNDFFATLSDPKLTSYEVNIEKMVKTSIKLIIKKIDKPKHYGRILVDGKLIIRDSVKIKIES